MQQPVQPVRVHDPHAPGITPMGAYTAGGGMPQAGRPCGVPVAVEYTDWSSRHIINFGISSSGCLTYTVNGETRPPVTHITWEMRWTNGANPDADHHLLSLDFTHSRMRNTWVPGVNVELMNQIRDLANCANVPHNMHW